MNKRVFVDMDGVLCEYRPWATAEDYESDGYFAGLAPRPSMVEAVKTLVESGETEVYVLSAVIPARQAQATAEKNAWLNEHLPFIDPAHRIFPLCGKSKADAVSGVGSNDILFDDYSLNLTQWQQAGGKAVKILNECNGQGGTFVSGPRLRVTGPSQVLDLVRSM